MPTTPKHYRPSHQPARQEQRRAYDRARRTAKPWRNWYKLAVWAAARIAQFGRQPLCERCLALGLIIPATVVNHRDPHEGDWSKFIDASNHESACAPCHDSVIQSAERAARLASRQGVGGQKS